jgi:hypothetical protein
MNLCKYKNILGAPNTGIHSYRVADFAVFDILLTIILAIFVSRIFKISLIYSIIIVFLLSIVIHRIFCVKTKMIRILFRD